MNSDGGKLFIGINDEKNVLGLKKDYETLGEKKNSDGFLLKLVDIINKYIGVEYHAYITSKIIKISDEDVCIVEILNSGKPAYINNEGKRDFYIRASASSQPLNIQEATEYIKNHWANMY
jgi:predicted HTH transcriptional regulator